MSQNRKKLKGRLKTEKKNKSHKIRMNHQKLIPQNITQKQKDSGN